LNENQDIGMAVVFLRSSGGSYITGDALVVDGANWLYRPPLAPRKAIREVSRGIEKKSRETGIPKSKM